MTKKRLLILLLVLVFAGLIYFAAVAQKNSVKPSKVIESDSVLETSPSPTPSQATDSAMMADKGAVVNSSNSYKLVQLDPKNFEVQDNSGKVVAKPTIEDSYFVSYFDEVNKGVFLLSRSYDYSSGNESVIYTFNFVDFATGMQKTIAKTEPQVIAGTECTLPTLVPTSGYLILKPATDGAQNCVAVGSKYKDVNGNVMIKI